MKITLLANFFILVIAVSAYGQAEKTMRGYLCSNLDNTAVYNFQNSYGEMAVFAKRKVERFRFVVFGIPMKITRALNRARPKTDPLGTEYRVTYIILANGTKEARRVARTGRFRTTPSCKKD